MLFFQITVDLPGRFLPRSHRPHHQRSAADGIARREHLVHTGEKRGVHRNVAPGVRSQGELRYRAVLTGRPIVVRSPSSVRPYQHVLDPLGAYLLLAQRQREDLGLAGSYNVGPEEQDCVTTGALADLFCAAWGEGASWTYPGATSGPREAVFLRLDCAKARSLLGWHPRWHVEEAVRETVDWTKAWRAGEDVAAYMGGQIADYIAE